MNARINDSPDLINKDPYGEGWLIRMEVDDPAQLDQLMDARAYQCIDKRLKTGCS